MEKRATDGRNWRQLRENSVRENERKTETMANPDDRDAKKQ